MIKRLLYYLIRPSEFSRRISQKRAEYINRKNFDIVSLEIEQESIFHKLNLTRDLGVQKRDSLASFFEVLNDSEHLTLFASISQVFEIKRILEIGTYDGQNARYLSILFPQAEIETMDLS